MFKETRKHLIGNKHRLGKVPWNKGLKGVQIAWNKGKSPSDETKAKISASKKGKTIKSKGVKRPQISGERSHLWKGGKSRDKHGGFEYRQWRSDVFERDNWTCQTCGVRGCYLEAHHIKSWAKYKDLRYELNNGVTLCKDCHKLTDNYKRG